MTDTDSFERMLEQRRLELARRLTELEQSIGRLGAMRDANNDDEHDPDGAPVSGEWSRLSGIRRETQAELSETDAALARIASGDYGVCASCGRPIPLARLEARPTAELCVTCAERAQRR